MKAKLLAEAQDEINNLKQQISSLMKEVATHVKEKTALREELIKSKAILAKVVKDDEN